MEAINYESMKTNEPTRNFDSVDITNDYNVAAQNSQGLYGAFKFFHGIKSFFKGISALGTLATTSKIPVTDNDGNVTYTTPAAIKTALSLVDSTALNGALANYPKYIYNANELFQQNTDKVIDLTNKVKTQQNYKITITGNYNSIYYYEGMFSVNLSNNKLSIITLHNADFTVTSTEAYKLTVNYQRSNSYYTISIVEC